MNAAWPPSRSAGVLLHPTSLPGGRIGPEAYAFVDWLAAAGQSFWQVLPLTPPDRHGSPYACVSAFAGSPVLLDAPDAAVSPSEERAFRRDHAYWIDGWADWLGSGGAAIADQVRFEREWLALRRHANSRGVRIIGDLPIYVARRSADVAAFPDLFDLTLEAGVPPDLFSSTGQLWGNPTLRWRASRRDGHRWWIERFRRAMQLVDATRIDHFRGFVAYWAVSRGSRTAQHGRWLRGPGLELFRTVEARIGMPPLIAEDLGVITRPVHRLREAIGAPGMHVLQFGFGSERDWHHPLRHRELSVAYTGTHDHPPIGGWWRALPPSSRAQVERALSRAGIAGDDPSWALVELALASPARLAVVQLQDLLDLGDEARMNTPGTKRGNWTWRVEPGVLTEGLAARLREAAGRRDRLRGGSARGGRMP